MTAGRDFLSPAQAWLLTAALADNGPSRGGLA